MPKAKKPVPKLRIAKGLSLDVDFVTKTCAILAQRRKGKTYTANVIAEEMVKAGIPWVALDPTGAWWGLRAGKDGGSKGGLPVYVFGGQHGDLPLEETAGKVIADLVIDQPGHYILDVSEFPSKAAQRRFAQDFGDRLFHRKAKNREVLHIFIDEADVFVPQKIPKGHEKLVGIYEEIVRRGGIRGIGTTLISQRSAIVNKNVLEQLDILIILRIVGPRDQKAILDYVEAEGDEQEVAELKSTIKRLKLGEAWFWEPGEEPPTFEKVQIRERRTFNSSATPDSGSSKYKVVKMKKVDLDALRGDIEATIEKAAQEDPEVLRIKVRGLEREVKTLTDELIESEQIREAAESKPKEVKVPVIDDETMEILVAALPAVKKLGSAISTALEKAGKPNPFMIDRPAPKPAPPRSARKVEPAVQPRETLPDSDELSKQEMKMLEVLVSRHPLPLSKTQWSTASGYSLRSSSWTKSVGRLVSLGYVANDHGSEYGPSDAAFDLFGGTPPEPESPEEIRATWRRSLKGPQAQAFFDQIIRVYPDAITREDLSEITEYSQSSSSFSSTVSLLRKNKLIEETDEGLRASSSLFE